MKKLRFTEPLPELILKGKKCITWRINDEKNIAVGDELSLCRLDGREFAKAKVVLVKETIFGDLKKEDKESHERFLSDKEMYRTYSEYYQMAVIPETKLKIIKFLII